MQCHMRLKISRVKNIDSVFQLGGVAFRLAQPWWAACSQFVSDPVEAEVKYVRNFKKKYPFVQFIQLFVVQNKLRISDSFHHSISLSNNTESFIWRNIAF